MNFIEKCVNFLANVSQTRDLSKTLKHYYEWNHHMQNFFAEKKETIIEFIIDVRTDNIIYSTSRQIFKIANTGIKNTKTLYQLNSLELYQELNGELFNIICKAVFDRLTTLQNLNKKQCIELAQRIVKFDETIFDNKIL